MAKNLAAKKKDSELRGYVESFVEAFYAGTPQSQDDARKILKSGGFTFFSGAIVELTPEVTENLARLAIRAAKLLGAKAGNEKALRDIAMKQAQDGVLSSASSSDVVTAVIDKIFEEGNAKYKYLVPNYLFVFEKDIRSVEIGRVSALMTADYAAEVAKKEGNWIQVVPGEGFSINPTGNPVQVTMHPLCWLVSVDASKENVEEEAKWLIDIAVSFLRLHYKQIKARFPRQGDVEPHPSEPPKTHNTGIKISEGGATSLGGGRVPGAYEIGKDVKATTLEPSFCDKAALVFDPPEKSLAERFSQGLGWLTRGRQAKDRAERLLYFFTAIESLLSSDDKTAPVVQNIARQAAVILTNDNSSRSAIASDLKKLYALRSALVHAGSRAVLSSNANNTEYLAEILFYEVLCKADLKSSHGKFLEGLSAASYGLPWPNQP